MKKCFKRILSLALAGTMVLGLCSCGGKKETDPALVAAAKENVYKYTELPLLDGMQNGEQEDSTYVDYSVSSVTYENGRVAALVNVYTYGMESWSNEMQLISMKEDGTERKVSVIWRQDPTTNSNTYINYIILSGKNVYGIAQSEDYENLDEYGTPKMTAELVCWDLEANEQWRVSVLPDDLEEGEWFYVENLMVLDNNRIMMAAMDKVTIFDQSGNVIGKFEPRLENGYDTVFTDRKGNICITTWNSDWTKVSIATLNMQTGEAENAFEVPFNISSYSIRESNVYDMLLTNSTGIFGYNFGDQEPTPIMNYVNSDLNTTNLNLIVELSETKFLASYYDRNYSGQYVSVFDYVDPSEIPDKAVLKVAGFYIPYEMRNRIIDFNKSSDQYRIIISDYSQYSTMDDYMAGYTKFNNDILAGNVPDIIIIDSEMPINSYIQKGLLADIYKFIDADEEINREDYFQNVFDAYSKDGRLYSIVPSFMAWMVIGKTSVVGSEQGWTMQDAKKLLASMPEGTSLFGETMTRDNLMYYAMMMSFPEFIDAETGLCDFESQGFKDLLEFFKSLPTEYEYNYEDPDFWTEQEMQYLNDKTLLMMTTIYEVPSMIYNFANFGTTDVTFKGFPTEKGNGAALMANYQYAISAQSPNQEGAWEFLRYYYTDEYQENLYEMSINKEIWLDKAMKTTERPYWEDENGNKEYYDYTTWLGGQEIKLDPLTEDQVMGIYDYVSSITQTYSYDQQLIDIINEEAAPFFEGKKTVDEVAKIIQGRIQIYVDEQG